MTRLHVHVGVENLAASIRFYSTLFAAEPVDAKAGLCEMDARQPARQFRDLARARRRRHPSSRHPGRGPRRTGEVYDRLKAADAPVLEEGATSAATRNRKNPGSPIRKGSRGKPSSPTATARSMAATRRHRQQSGERELAGTPRAAAPRPRAGRKPCGCGRRRPSNALADRTYNALFLCTGNSARSIFAEAILNRLGRGRFQAYSAGSQPQRRGQSRTLELLKRLHFDTRACAPRAGTSSRGPARRRSISSSPSATTPRTKMCPIWPGQPMTAHWGVPDPAAATGRSTRSRLRLCQRVPELSRRISLFVACRSQGRSLSCKGGWTRSGRDAAPAAPNDATPTLRGAPSPKPWAPRCCWSRWSAPASWRERLAGGNVALALLANAIADRRRAHRADPHLRAGIRAPISTRSVTLAVAGRGEMPPACARLYRRANGRRHRRRVARACHVRPADPPSVGACARHLGELMGEFVATFGSARPDLERGATRAGRHPLRVAAYITGAYWFTSSTSFANPAVTFARSLTTVSPASRRATCQGSSSRNCRRSGGVPGVRVAPSSEAAAPDVTVAF